MPAQNNTISQPGFYRHIEACNRHVPADYLPLLRDGQQIGLVKRGNVPLLAQFPDVFAIESSGVRLTVPGGPAERTEALLSVTNALVVQDIINFRDEFYRVDTGWGTPVLASIDRGAAYLFGVRCYGIHLNGFVRAGDEIMLWVAHRAKDRAVAPGQLDHLVAGGMPGNLSARETMTKEAEEEAGIPASLAAQAKAVGVITYWMDRSNGVSRDTIFVYDLELSSGFIPHNTDGEVERFELLPVQEVAEIVRTSDCFKWNCNLVLIDFLIRHGYLDASHPEYTHLCQGLHRKL